MLANRRMWMAGVCGLAALAWGSATAWAQTITLTAPTAAMEFRDGDDFATTVTGDPCDMDRVRDIPWDYNLYDPSVNAGVWSAYFMQAGPTFYPLFDGYSTATYTNYPIYYTGGMPLGPRNPIDASVYNRVSYRLALTQSVRSSVSLAWTTNANADPSVANNALSFVDGDWATPNWYKYADGFRIYDLGFTQTEFFYDRVSSADIQPGFTTKGSWQGRVVGFFVQPTDQGTAGTPIQLDWLRFYNGNSSPTLRLTWTTTGVPNNDSVYSVQLWVTSTAGAGASGGDLMMTGIKNDGVYDVKTAALPPGTYYFYLKAMQRTSGGYVTLATSALSPAVRITEAPRVTFAAPSFTSGADYAATVLGNAWDMADTNDIYNPLHITNETFSGGYLTALANPPAPGATESDAQFLLNARLNGTAMPIDTTTYRYLSYTMLVETNGYTNINDRVARGWVARVIAYNDGIAADGTELQGMPLWEGVHTYTIDLWDTNAMETINPYPKQLGWRAAGSYKNVRFDPLEVPQSTRFYVDDFKLCADNAPRNNAYTLAWTASDADSATLSVSLSYGTLTGTNFSGAVIATVSQSPGAGSYAWDTSEVPKGTYYLRATVSDGSNTVNWDSKVPIVVTNNGVASSYAAGGDYDGDRLADPAVYASSRWSLYLSSRNYAVTTLSFGVSGGRPVLADYDGDRLADPTVASASSGDWYLLLSAGAYQQRGPFALGRSGYTAVAGDFDGDGFADPGVASTGAWYLYLSRSGYAQSGPFAFGASDQTPVAADFDGDGFCDLAGVTAAGQWYVWMSGRGYAQSGPFALGGAGSAPLAADFDGDGYADPALYGSGTWTFYLSGRGYATVGPVTF